MTTWTSEDKEEAYRKKVEDAPYHPGYEDAVVYPTVIVDSGASHQTLGEFIAHKKMVNELLEEIDVQKKVIQSLSETGQKLYDENRHLKESFRSISNQLTNMMELWEFKR